MSDYLIADTTLTAIAGAIRAKTGETAQMTPLEMPGEIAAISGGGGTVYVPGTPVSFALSGWDPDVQGTTYTLECIGYKIGDGGLQLGLPSDSSAVNTQAVVAGSITSRMLLKSRDSQVKAFSKRYLKGPE